MQTALATNSAGVPAGALESLTDLNKALGDSIRLQILRLLKSESFGVLELCRILGIRQSALSHHLKILSNAQLVSTRREGNSIFYRRVFLSDDDYYREIKESVFDQVDLLPLARSAEKKISQIQLERAQQSLSFFNKNADKFKEQQGLIVAHDDYGSILHDVIDSLGLNDKATVLEVGPGEGLLLTELAAKFKKLIALDNSKEMLEKSKEAIAKGKFNGVQFILGDTTIARKKDVLSDLIIFDMVLHHISSPTKTFKDSSALLNENGYLLIADLSTHDQDWVRESCGDLWLGFDETDLNHWAQKAGLVTGQSSYLGLRNGFQIQIRVFRKH
ncbi:MAG: metalloregulator ArsR/SmtB family transcription factor [Pseudomonadota bacterium]|jgi:ArsR family transcriptional regulator|nr:metalloregulator ArsR/SmtB family transcription factor [Pseudomonadota bacterium]